MDINWKEVPAWASYIAADLTGTAYFYETRPVVDIDLWSNPDEGHCEPANDYPEIVIPKHDNWLFSLRQRPGTWDKVARAGDHVILADNLEMVVVEINNVTGMIVGHTGDYYTAPIDPARIKRINGIPTKAKEQTNRVTLPFEVFNNNPIDVDRAMEVTRQMSKGVGLC